MKRFKKYTVNLILCIFLLSFFSLRVSAEERGRVLFISSYSYEWENVQAQIAGLNEGLKSAVIDYEFMHSCQVYDDVSERLLFDSLSYRLQHLDTYDVVILGNDEAFRFAMKYRNELFAGIPLLFMGVNDEKIAVEAAEDPMVNGIVEKLSVEKNIELGRQLIPEAKKVYAILDDSQTSQMERERYFECAKKYPDLEFQEINTSQLTTTKLKMALHNVEKDSIVIYYAITKDASGKRYSDSEAINLLVKDCEAPVMRMVESGIGEGLLGGYVVSMTETGRLVGQMAEELVTGKDLAAMEEKAGIHNVYMLDATVMKNHELDTAKVPKETIFVNEPISFFERNREVIVPGICVLVAMLLVLGGVGFDNLKRRKLMKSLEETRVMLESASQHDFLTGLPNRSKFMLDLQRLIKEKHPCTIMMVDIDDFKFINDTYGHSIGDEALKELARRLKKLQSPILTPYRLAGDEFILILESNQSKIVENAVIQCCQQFESKYAVAPQLKLRVCGSVGIASYPKDADSLEQLVICADKAMYHVKKDGKNSFAFYQKEE